MIDRPAISQPPATVRALDDDVQARLDALVDSGVAFIRANTVGDLTATFDAHVALLHKELLRRKVRALWQPQEVRRGEC